jgi:hypothetical protein
LQMQSRKLVDSIADSQSCGDDPRTKRSYPRASAYELMQLLNQYSLKQDKASLCSASNRPEHATKSVAVRQICYSVEDN